MVQCIIRDGRGLWLGDRFKVMSARVLGFRREHVTQVRHREGEMNYMDDRIPRYFIREVPATPICYARATGSPVLILAHPGTGGRRVLRSQVASPVVC
eukprot:139631-Rhodomonas_salina.3